MARADQRQWAAAAPRHILAPPPAAAVEAARALPGPPRVAVALAAALGLDDGAWTTESDGGARWELRIGVDGARSLGLRLHPFRVPDGAQLWIDSVEGERVGPFDARHRNRRGELWLPPVAGDELRLTL